VKTSGCSDASSATLCAIRKVPTCSTWSSASGRPRSGSTGMKTSRRGNELEIILDGHVDQPKPCASSVPSAISRTSPISPKIRTTSGRCGHAPPPPDRRAPGTLALALSHAHAAGFSAAESAGRFFRGSTGQPRCWTAHPTEVRPARARWTARGWRSPPLLDRARKRVQLTPEEFEADAEQVAPAACADAVADQSVCAVPSSPCSTRSPTASHFMITTFLHEVAAAAIVRWRTGLNQAADGPRGGWSWRSFLRVGKLDWRATGDGQPVRDGGRDARNLAPAEQPAYCAFYLEELHTPSRAELSARGASCRCLEGFA